MPGGVLQVAARGTEDIYLTDNPHITFFKTVYRRYTNFSKTEFNLKFTNKLDFSREGYCRLDHYGDLVYRLFLNVKLPKINLTFKNLCISEVQDLLKIFDVQ
jgi:hypothetical protein